MRSSGSAPKAAAGASGWERIARAPTSRIATATAPYTAIWTRPSPGIGRDSGSRNAGWVSIPSERSENREISQALSLFLADLDPLDAGTGRPAVEEAEDLLHGL